MINLNVSPFSKAQFKVIPMQTKKIVNVSSVPKLSPFRYPGGKTWLVPQIRKWLESLPEKPQYFIEPFTGGGIASLTAVIENRVETAVMCELDRNVAAVWRVILNNAPWLADRILGFAMTVENVNEILSVEALDDQALAFQTIIMNRAQRGGILAKGAGLMKTGENGKGVASRWYPETLAKRITLIHQHRDRIEFVEGDGLAVAREYLNDPQAVFFVDPPYTAGGKNAGKRLYAHNELDHLALFDLMQQAAGHFMMTYDEAPEVVDMAQDRDFRLARVPMKNTHNNTMFELLVTSRQAVVPARRRAAV